MASVPRPTGPSEFTRQPKPVFFGIPKQVGFPDGQVRIIRNMGASDEVVYDVTQFVANTVSIDGKAITDGTSQAAIDLLNPDGKWVDPAGNLSVFKGGEYLIIDIGYDGNLKRQFKGKIKPGRMMLRNGVHMVKIEAITAPEVADRDISITLDGAVVSAIESIIDTYLSDVLTHNNFTANLTAVSTSVKQSFEGKITRILKDLFQIAGFQGSIDFDPNDTGKHDLRGHLAGALITEGIAIGSTQNILDMPDYGTQENQIFNNIRLLGKTVGGRSLMTTVVNTAHRNQFWRKDIKINDTKITNRQELIERANLELLRLSNAPDQGSFMIFGEPDLVCGENVHVISPDDGINVMAQVAGYKHTLGTEFLTEVHIERRPRKQYTLIQERIIVDEQARQFDNVNDADYGINFSLESDDELIASSSNITYANGNIQISAGQSQGSVQSVKVSFDDIVSQFDLILESPQQFELSKIEISTDDGVSFQSADLNTEGLQDLTTPSKSALIKITLIADGDKNQYPALGGLSVYFKV